MTRGNRTSLTPCARGGAMTLVVGTMRGGISENLKSQISDLKFEI
jgi:hypothetical protein